MHRKWPLWLAREATTGLPSPCRTSAEISMQNLVHCISKALSAHLCCRFR